MDIYQATLGSHSMERLKDAVLLRCCGIGNYLDGLAMHMSMALSSASV